MKQPISVFVLLVLFLSSTPTLHAQGGKSQTKSSVKQVQQSPEVVIETPDASTDGKGVFLKWHTVRETENLGFYVNRIDNGNKSQVGGFVQGSALRYGKETVSEEYSVFDPEGSINSQYQIDSYLTNGKKVSTDAVAPKYVSKLSSVGPTPSARKTPPPPPGPGPVEIPGIVTSDSPTFSAALQAAIDASIKPADAASQKSVAAQSAAKIAVRHPGMYRVTKAQLQTAGFDINSNSTNWQLYANGNEQSILVGPNGDYFDFYGHGLDVVESDTQMYYLVAGSTPGKRMSILAAGASSSTKGGGKNSGNFLQNSLVKERTGYVSTWLNGPAENYIGAPVLKGPAPPTLDINLPAVDRDRTVTSAHLIVKMVGFTPGKPHVVNLLLNGQNIGQMSGSGTNPFVFDGQISPSALVDGTNTIEFDCISTLDVSFIDSIQVVYSRSYVASQNQLLFTSSGTADTQLSGFSSPNIRIFDVTNDGDPAQVTGFKAARKGGSGSLPSTPDRLMFAVEDSGLLSPASITLNSPSTLSVANHNADLVIVSYKDFMTQANAWADYRRGQGFSVEVVNVEDIYDEFNYGVLSAQSVKDFLGYAKNNWQTPPRYVLLIGDGSYDPRNYENFGNWDLVPAMMFDAENEETASDDALVDFNDDGLAEMAIGRIPARTPADVSNALSKTMTFEGGGQDISRGALFAYHGSSPTWDFAAMSQGLADQLPGTPAAFVSDQDAGAQSTLIADMNTGEYMVNFSGHGTFGAWIGNGFFSLNQVPQLTNIDHPSVFTMLTCLNGYFVIPNGSQSLAEFLLNSTTGGAAASWASAGTTTPDIQQVMATRFYQKVGEGTIPRLGDLTIDAKTVLVDSGRDVRLSWVLVGDPTLKVR